jgi:hypothetical protein
MRSLTTDPDTIGAVVKVCFGEIPLLQLLPLVHFAVSNPLRSRRFSSGSVTKKAPGRGGIPLRGSCGGTIIPLRARERTRGPARLERLTRGCRARFPARPLHLGGAPTTSLPRACPRFSSRPRRYAVQSSAGSQFRRRCAVPRRTMASMECDPSEKLDIANRDRHHRNRGRNCYCRQHPPEFRSPRVFRW